MQTAAENMKHGGRAGGFLPCVLALASSIMRYPVSIPCKHADTAADALREYARGARIRVSELAVRGGGGIHEPAHTAIITERRRRGRGADPEAPEQRYIAFATNRPDTGPGGYGRRWNIEVGCRIPEGRAGRDAAHGARGPHVLPCVLVPVLQRVGGGRRPAGRGAPHAEHARQGPEVDGACNGAWQAPV